MFANRVWFHFAVVRLSLTCGVSAQTIPFVPPWNDATPSMPDFTAMNSDIGTNRLAKFDVNAIRFHHMDASWAYNGG